MSKKTFNFILNTLNAVNINNGDKRFNIRLDNLQGKDYKLTCNFKSIIFSTTPAVVDRLITISADVGQSSVFSNDLLQTNVSKIISVSQFAGNSFINYFQDDPVFIERVANTNSILISIRNNAGNIPLVDIPYILVLHFEEI